MKFDDFLNNLPNLHSWDGGETWNTGGFERYHLDTLISFLKPNVGLHPKFLETGAGCSTIALLFLQPSKLTSIAPEASLFDRIVDYCRSNQISTSSLVAKIARSEWELAVLANNGRSEAELDFALIDGGHGWPTVFVDFFYVNYLLREGGYVMIDDIQLKTVRELANLLFEQPGYKLVLNLGKSLVFRKETADRYLPEWNGQPYIVEQSKLLSTTL